MRKRILGLGAAAVMMTGSGKVNAHPEWVTRESAGSASISKLPMMLQGSFVAKNFANAKTEEEFARAEAIWITLRPGLAKYEMSLSCKDYGASHDKEIAINLVEELIKKPLSLMMDVSKVVLWLAAQEKDPELEALKDAAKDLAKFYKDKTVEEGLERLAGGKAVERFKEALLKYLQSKSKRSRKYFLQLIGDIVSIAKAYGGLILKAGEALSPSRINPEDCGMEVWIERERASALRRIFSSVETSGRLNLP